jgi:hypothetical protein
METHMQDVITIGKRLIPLEQIAFVEPFDPATNPDFKPEKEFKSRIVQLNRDTVLAEIAPPEFAEANGFAVLAEDSIAVNPRISFKVETFTPSENFNPEKAYLTRLKWRDPEGNEQSKLLLTKPESVILVVMRGGSESETPRNAPPQRPIRTRPPRRRGRKLEAAAG